VQSMVGIMVSNPVILVSRPWLLTITAFHDMVCFQQFEHFYLLANNSVSVLPSNGYISTSVHSAVRAQI